MRILFSFLALIALSGTSLSAEEVRLLSYNVRHGVDMDGKPAMDRQAAILRESNAQVIGLQEIDEKCGRSGKVDQTEKFAELTKMEGRFGSFMPYDGGRYGLAILSKLPIKKSDVIKLPDGREPRVAVVLEVETAGGVRLLVANVHFDWTSEKLRVPQAQALLNHLSERDLPTVVLGDYNAEPNSATLELFKQAGFEILDKQKDSRLTWNARNPTVDIDHVAIRNGGGTKIVGKSIAVLPEAEASDHRPVTATIVLNSVE